MSPEQARNAKHVDGRADIWSLAVVLWEALTGKRLWGQQSSLGELIVAICTDPIGRVDEVAPWVPRDLGRVVHKGLERDLNQRTASMQSFIAALELFAGGSDRVSAAELVGLDDERKQELVRKSGAPAIPRRTTLEPPGDAARVNQELPILLNAPAPLHVMPVTSAVPEARSSAWLVAVIVAVLAAVAVAVVLLR
jgi:serine/threonine-protein kinase